jgi:hypothetical protein
MQDGARWLLADNADPELRRFVATLPPQYTATNVHDALEALATGNSLPAVPASHLLAWVATPEAHSYCQKAFLNRKPTPATTFDEVLTRAHKAWQSDLIAMVHTFLVRRLNG